MRAKTTLNQKIYVRENKAQASRRHPVYYFEFWTKVYNGKGIIQSIHSSFGANTEGDRVDYCITSDALLFFSSAYTFSSEIVFVSFTKKNLSYFILYLVHTYYSTASIKQ